MSSKLTPYHPPPQMRSGLLRSAPDAVPSVEDLEQLHAELKMLRQTATARSKKATEDLRAIEDSMRRMKEKEKGKARAVEKVKRERDHTPLLAEDTRSSSNSYLPGSKPRLSSHTNSSIPTSARSSVDPRRSAIEEKKQKKRKHAEVDPGESDGNHSAQRTRKGSPANIHVPSYVQASKAQKSTPSTSVPHPKIPSGPDFSLPAPQSLLPIRPPIPVPPIPGPSKQSEVTEDFSKAKQPPQTLVTTFYSSIEPYLRNIREEDVGFLEYTGDEVEPYVMPKLGVHYTEVWEEQDSGGLPIVLGKLKEAPASTFVAPRPTWDPSTLTEPDLLGEARGHGPLTERVISALLPIPDLGVWKGVKAAEDAMEGRPGGSGAAAARRERLNVSDLENRIRDTMRFHGLLESVPDFSEKVDDPIATALRHAQQELRTVVATNKARKEQLAAIARDRLGYQEYLDARDMIDKSIATLYAKLQKKDTPKLSKKKKKPLVGAAAAAAAAAAANGDGEGANVPPAPCPAALGLTPDEENRLTVNDQLKHLVEARRQWVDHVGSIFEEKQRHQPGRIYRFPKESVFQGIEEEVRNKLLIETMNGTGNGRGDAAAAAPPQTFLNGVRGELVKGKGRAMPADDAMDIG